MEQARVALLVLVHVGLAACAACGGSGVTSNISTPDDAATPGAETGSSDAGTSPSTDAASILDAAAPIDSGGDTPFACSPSMVPGPTPVYAVGGALPAHTGGVLTPGLYRAVKGTHLYRESVAGACVGVTPPVTVVYRMELEFRATHCALRVESNVTSGTWTTSGTTLAISQDCPDVKAAGKVPYTISGDTLLFTGPKQDYNNGAGCQFLMQYELERQ